MNRYHLDVILRSNNPRGEEGPERVLGVRITAPSELMARRIVLQRAYSQRLLVSRFLSVQRRTKR